MLDIIIGMGLTAAVILCVLVFRSFYRIEEGHAAALSSFGKLKKDTAGNVAIVSPGLHMKAPWQQFHEFSVMERTLTIREENREVELLARDGTLLRLDPQVRFRFMQESAESFIFGLNKPISHLREYFRSLISAEVANFGNANSEEGSYAEIRRNRALLQTRLESDAQKKTMKQYGIEFKAAEVIEILPPADLAQALNSVQKVEAENTTLLARFRAECEQQIASAEHGVEIAAIKAEATEKEIHTLANAVQELHEDGVLSAYLQRRRDEISANSKTLYLKH